MPYEVELKFPIEDFSPVEQQLRQMGAVAGPTVQQSDCYFAHPLRDFARTDEALRIRSVAEANCITYKGPKIDATTKTRHEIELPLAPGSAAREQYAELLEALGFRPVAEVRKTRRAVHLQWQDLHVEVACDNVQGVGQFLELEAAADEAALPRVRALLVELASQLGLERTERRSYLELLLAQRGPGAPP